jgi:uncharacterized membrane protein
VLDLHVPRVEGDEAALWQALLAILPVVGVWVVSYAFVLVFWVAHHYFFNSLKKVDRGVLWLNGLFLLTISFTPFPTSLAGQYPAAKPAVFLLSLAMFLTAASFSLLRWYSSFSARLIDPQWSPQALRRAMARSLIAPALYFLGMILSLVWTPFAIFIQVLVPVIFFLPSRVDQAPIESAERRD